VVGDARTKHGFTDIHHSVLHAPLKAKHLGFAKLSEVMIAAHAVTLANLSLVHAAPGWHGAIRSLMKGRD
jgi:hypothetical protein